MVADLAHWIALSSVPGIGPVNFRRLCDRFGGPRKVLAARREDLESVRGLDRPTIAALRVADRLLPTAEQTAARLRDAGFDALTFHEPAYPRCLLDLENPPPILYTLGRLPCASDRRFAIAGSTSPSERSSKIAADAGWELAEAGWTVVSGYAPGIDTAAHLGALDGGGRTVLVLPTGALAFRLRPEFERFSDRLGTDIALVSESLPDAPWSAQQAVLRDRIIAALGEALLVVEARPDNGTLITFRHARKLGRPAYVVRFRRPPPGAGGNELAVREGGLPVDSLAAFRSILEAPALPRSAPVVKQTELF